MELVLRNVKIASRSKIVKNTLCINSTLPYKNTVQLSKVLLTVLEIEHDSVNLTILYMLCIRLISITCHLFVYTSIVTCHLFVYTSLAQPILYVILFSIKTICQLISTTINLNRFDSYST